jgi:hypothetical protein
MVGEVLTKSHHNKDVNTSTIARKAHNFIAREIFKLEKYNFDAKEVFDL